MALVGVLQRRLHGVEVDGEGRKTDGVGRKTEVTLRHYAGGAARPGRLPWYTRFRGHADENYWDPHLRG